MRLKRTIYADKDGLYSQIMVERTAASGNAGLSSLPKYRRQYWLGRANGLEWAANIIRDWAGEHEPEPREDIPALDGRHVETRMVPELGITLDGVWISMNLMGELDEQGTWDAEFSGAFISLNDDQQRVLIDRQLAVKETKGGCHRGPALTAFMNSLVWPAEGTK